MTPYIFDYFPRYIELSRWFISFSKFERSSVTYTMKILNLGCGFCSDIPLFIHFIQLYVCGTAHILISVTLICGVALDISFKQPHSHIVAIRSCSLCFLNKISTLYMFYLDFFQENIIETHWTRFSRRRLWKTIYHVNRTKRYVNIITIIFLHNICSELCKTTRLLWEEVKNQWPAPKNSKENTFRIDPVEAYNEAIT